MKQTIYATFITAFALCFSTISFAQKKDTTEINIDNIRIIVTDKGDTLDKKESSGRHSIEISNHGIKYHDAQKPAKKEKNLHVGMHFDFGMNNIIDNTNYNGPLSKNVLQDTVLRTLKSNDLDLLNVNSINFNFWPLWLRQNVAKQNVQLETGLGFQFFNYQFDTRVRHSDKVPADLIPGNPNSPIYNSGFEEINDPTQLIGKEKNKLGVSYVSVPLMLRFNSNEHNDHCYFFGFGVIGSYKLKSWTKFYGDKESGRYGINDWMAQLTAELGVTGIIKLYGTYALQSMYDMSGQGGLDRRPFAIGIRL